MDVFIDREEGKVVSLTNITYLPNMADAKILTCGCSGSPTAQQKGTDSPKQLHRSSRFVRFVYRRVDRGRRRRRRRTRSVSPFR